MLTCYLALFLSFLFPVLSKAGNIVVTTNSDAGAGSLRWAIETANNNGTATQDVIQFNIPGTAFTDHVILLASELPALTSNMIIDGSTQPGQPFGITTAKVALKFDQYAPTFSNIKIENARNVGVYGLYLYIGYWEGLFWSPNSQPARSSLLYGVNISNSFNIEIGAPGKGNVINGARFGITLFPIHAGTSRFAAIISALARTIMLAKILSPALTSTMLFWLTRLEFISGM
jgi:hypothetical protein